MFSEFLNSISVSNTELDSDSEVLELLNEEFDDVAFFAKLSTENSMDDEEMKSAEEEFDSIDINKEM